MADVDLNPIRAKTADSLESSDFTSMHVRLDAVESPMAPLLRPFAGDSHKLNNLEHIPYNLIEYIQLVEWTDRQMRSEKRGHISSNTPQIFVRLNIRTESWLKNCEHLESVYPRVQGD